MKRILGLAVLSLFVTAGAAGPSFAGDLTVNGNIGVGTVTPARPVDVVLSNGSVNIEDTLDRPTLSVNGNANGAAAVMLQLVSTNTSGTILLGRSLDFKNYYFTTAGEKVWVSGVSGDLLNTGASQTDLSGQLRFLTRPSGYTTPFTRMIIKDNGYVGVGTNYPTEAFYVVGNIYATGNITQGSSRELKEDISSLSAEEAIKAFRKLEPVKYRYKADEKDMHVGFIAEDVPDVVASSDRKSLSPMDLVAVLTKVVQEQQKTIAELSEKVDALDKRGSVKGIDSMEDAVCRPTMEKVTYRPLMRNGF